MKSQFKKDIENIILEVLGRVPFPVSRWQLSYYLKDIEFEHRDIDLLLAVRRLENRREVRCHVRTVGHGLEKLYAKKGWVRK